MSYKRADNNQLGDSKTTRAAYPDRMLEVKYEVIGTRQFGEHDSTEIVMHNEQQSEKSLQSLAKQVTLHSEDG